MPQYTITQLQSLVRNAKLMGNVEEANRWAKKLKAAEAAQENTSGDES
jgi:hypothetical protein